MTIRNFNNIIVHRDLRVKDDITVEGTCHFQANVGVLGRTNTLNLDCNNLVSKDNTTLRGNLKVESTEMNVPHVFTIDLERSGPDFRTIGTLQVNGNLEVEGTYNVISKNELEIIDKQIIIGRHNTNDITNSLVQDTGIIFGKNNVDDEILGSFLYKYDNDTEEEGHEQYFETSLPIRSTVGWRATEDNEFITKGYIDENNSKKFKVVEDQKDVDNWTYEDFNFSPLKQNMMIWILNKNPVGFVSGRPDFSEDLNFILEGRIVITGKYVQNPDSDLPEKYQPEEGGEPILLHPGMNFLLYDRETGWHPHV